MSSEPRLTATARVQITVEIDAGSNWGPDCPAEQIFRQAQTESVQRVLAALEGRCTIVGKPVVIAVFAREAK